MYQSKKSVNYKIGNSRSNFTLSFHETHYDISERQLFNRFSCISVTITPLEPVHTISTFLCLNSPPLTSCNRSFPSSHLCAVSSPFLSSFCLPHSPQSAQFHYSFLVLLFTLSSFHQYLIGLRLCDAMKNLQHENLI